MIAFSEWKEAFRIRPGLIALIGGGGKTTLMNRLARHLSESGSVLMTTSTHIFPPEGVPFSESIKAPLPTRAIFAVGTPCENGKLTAPKQRFSELMRYADYVLVEADGSKGMPLKAHAAYEPVVPKEADAVIAVLGLDGIGKPILEAAHRPERYAELLGVSVDTVVTPGMAAAVLNGYPDATAFLLNKADTPKRLEYAKEIAALLHKPAAIAALGTDSILEIRRNETC